MNVFPAEADLTDLYEHAEMPEIEIDTINDYDERGKTPLLYAASIGHLETVMNMLKAGADVNKPAQNSTDTGTSIIESVQCEEVYTRDIFVLFSCLLCCGAWTRRSCGRTHP